MADVFQGAPLPTITTTEQKQQVLPEFYTNYLQDIANIGTGAIQQGGVAGFSPLQQQAFQMAPQTAFSGAQTAGDAASLLGAAGTTAAPSMVGAYMNPYMTNVVDEMARLQNQNIQRSVLPALRGAGVGSGSFGSTRQANVTGQSLADMQRNLLGKQYEALYSGYGDAMKSAQTDLNRQMQAGQGLGNVAQQQYSIGTGGLKTLEDLGAQQQALGQRQLDYPMIQAQNLAKLFQGLNVPSGETLQKVGPGQQGQYSLSPLSQISGLLTGLGAFMGQPSGATGTTGGTQQQTGLQNILGLPQAAFDQLISLGRGIGLPLKDGGMASYAKGGNVKPVPANFQNYLKNKAKRNS
jgi:hypothetical protein